VNIIHNAEKISVERDNPVTEKYLEIVLKDEEYDDLMSHMQNYEVELYDDHNNSFDANIGDELVDFLDEIGIVISRKDQEGHP
jgi:hypothetical protein